MKVPVERQMMRQAAPKLLALLVCSFSLPAQTTNIAVPAASGGGIKYVLPQRLGINLDSQNNYGNNQLMDNLINVAGTSFQPQIWNESSVCAATGASTTLWPDANVQSPQPINFEQGATFQVISGADIGATGTITSSTMGNGSTVGPNYTIAPALSAPCASGDLMIVRCRTPLGTCAGGPIPIPAYASGTLGPYLTGAGALTFETSDLSPSSSAIQALQMYAPVYSPDGFSNDNAGIAPAADNPLPPTFGGGVFLNLNGNYTLTFRAKATSGAPIITYRVYRTGGAYYLNSTVTPTVNATPGAGWTNYSFSFSASETGAQNQNIRASLVATGGVVLLQDMGLNEVNSATGNDTAFRDAVFLKLQAYKPGTLRFMNGGTYGCTFDAVITTPALNCGSISWADVGYVNPWSLSQFLYLAAKVGANPWFTMSPWATPADWANAAAYFNAPCSSGNSYATIRCNFLAGTPYAGETWLQVFNSLAPSGVGNIYLENGNEVWNGPNGIGFYINNGMNYGYLVGADNAALKAAPYYSAQIHQVASGHGGGGIFSSVQTILAAACGVTNGCPDFIDDAPYAFNYATDITTPNLWTSMFTEPVNLTQPGGDIYSMQNYAFTNFGVNGAVYETNLGTSYGITGTTQAQIDGIVGGIGSGLDATLNMLLAARDVGIGVQNLFALPEIATGWYESTSVTCNCQTQSSTLYSPLWGANRYMSGPEATNSFDRPSGLMFQGINQAIGSKLNILNTVQTGTPTYNQAGAQPDPTGYVTTVTGNLNSTTTVSSVSSFGNVQVGQVITGTGIPIGATIAAINTGASTITLSVAATATATGVSLTTVTNSIAANSAVPYVQVFGFGDGLGNYSVVAYNLDSVSSHAITFSGSGAPTGSCTKTVFTSTNITDNNETTYLDQTPVVSYPSPASYPNCYTGDTLPPYSMTTYTYTVGTPTAYPPVLTPSSGNVPQTVTITDSSTGSIICTRVGATPATTGTGSCAAGSTLYTAPITVSSAETLNAIAGAGSTTYLDSTVSSGIYTTGNQTWYVRQDGAGRYDAARVSAGFTGAAIGCNGLYDAAYPGSGTNQNCAFGDFRFLYDDQTYMNWPNWVIAGGDTVIVRGCAAITANSTTTGQAAGLACRIGYDFGGPCSGAGCGAGYTWCYGASPCGIPPPPSGSSGHPTLIEGGCAPSCSTGTPNTTTLRPNQAVLPELYALYGLNTVFDTSGTNYLTVDGLFIDAHDNCIKHISPSVSPCSTTAPYSQFADEGIRRDPSTNNLILTDVLIVGMQDSALIGPMNGTETYNDVELAYNGFTGDNYDDGTHSQSGGVITRNNFTVLWTGCTYNYGSSFAIPITYCADDSSSGNGDGTATPSVSHDTFVNTYETMAYNMQDGDDVGHNQDPGSVAWYKSIAYANEGGTFKSGGQSAIMVNNLSVGNCRRSQAPITGAPSTFNTYLGTPCRAGGDGVGLNFLGGGSGETIQLYNNSIVSYGGTMIDVQIQGGGSCTSCVFSFQNNAIMGYVNPSFSSSQPQMWNTVTPNSPTYNLYYNLSSCPASGTGEVCTSPLWVGQPATPTTDSGLDNFDFYPTNPGSPLIHGGGAGGLTPVADYFGVSTTSPPVIGAVNAMVAATPLTIYGDPKFYGGLTIY